MLKEDLLIPKEEKKSFPPIPENVYQVELFDVNTELKPKYKNPEEKEEKLSFQFVLLAGKDKDGSELRGRNVWRNFIPTSLYIGKTGKNLLYQVLEAILGRELSPEDEATMDGKKINSLIGRQLRVIVKNETKDGKVYSNIETFLSKEIDYPALTEEEKEDARVKNEKEETESIPNVPEVFSLTELEPSDIKF